ncbi:MAG: mannitol-1-phosphate 5-dehydrogenase [Treponema sp.]|jgi:mannitol-1-phosphate 5-dehydrogenase|nr:mannitol-1-phosphate 5-dehydrogenase [Treponema sp.]
MKLIQFGAGNIGRSFIGHVFSRSGWDVVFVDIDEKLVRLLNEKKSYTVAIKREGTTDELRTIAPVRAVDGRDDEAVSEELADADIAATSVGKNALVKILPVIAAGLDKRRRRYGERPLDIIIAENSREAPELFRTVLSKELGDSYPLDRLVGIVETSIGKMVPIMRKEDLTSDPLLLFAEEYETLIVDKRSFKGPIPDIKSLCPVEPIKAYVDRKLFIHNLGHAATAYFGYRSKDLGDPRIAAISRVLDLPGIEHNVRQAMNQSAEALLVEYPGVFGRQDLSHHIDGLISRFKNVALADTVHRVGRDIPRKLGRDDRLTGAMLLCAKHGLPFGAIADVYRAAMDFACPDEDGVLFPPDAEFRKRYALPCPSTGYLSKEPGGTGESGMETIRAALPAILTEVSGLDRADPVDSAVYNGVLCQAE